MRRVNYKVMDVNGVVFDTTDYERAIMAGNRIVATYLTDVDLTTEKAKNTAKIHRLKVRAKKGLTPPILSK